MEPECDLTEGESEGDESEGDDAYLLTFWILKNMCGNNYVQ